MVPPAAFRFTAEARTDSHLEAAAEMDADAGQGGELLDGRLIEMVRATGVPCGLNGLGYGESDIPALVKGAYAQQRLLAQSPRDVTEGDLDAIYRDAMKY